MTMSAILEDLVAWLARADFLASALDATVKGSAVVAALLIAMRIARRASAAARHLAWGLAALGLLALPALSTMLPGWRILPAWMDSRQVASAEKAGRALPADSADVRRALPTQSADVGLALPADPGVERTAGGGARPVEFSPAVPSPRPHADDVDAGRTLPADGATGTGSAGSARPTAMASASDPAETPAGAPVSPSPALPPRTFP